MVEESINKNAIYHVKVSPLGASRRGSYPRPERVREVFLKGAVDQFVDWFRFKS